MRRSRVTAAVVLLLSVAGVLLVTHGSAAVDSIDEEATRKQAHQAFKDGNWADALDGFRKLATRAESDATKVSEDLQKAVDCLNQLGRQSEFDSLVEDSIAAHTKNWRLLRQAARLYRDTVHYGFLVTGEFERGGRRGRGKQVNSFERDRVRSLQLFDQAWKTAVEAEAPAEAVRQVLDDYAQVIRMQTQRSGAWMFQRLTDLETLPDYEEGYWYGYRGTQSGGAPVGEDGNPVFYEVPESFEGASSDGERWRWLLAEGVRLVPAWKANYEIQYADFLWEQFGVQTLASYGWWGRQTDDAEDRNAGKYAVHTLSDDETIAKLATGVRRLQLPDEHNFLRIYRSLAKGDIGPAPRAGLRVAEICENRRQYPKAATEWRALIKRHGQDRFWQQRLDQIVGNWGQFEATRSQAAGSAPSIDYRYRNGKSVSFEAFPIDVEKLLGEVKAYLKGNPQQIDWQTVNLGQIGHRIVTQNQQKYVGERVAQWSLDLDPPNDHSDRRVTVRTPLQQPGAYLVKATIAGGNTSRIVLWVDDSVIVKKQLDGEVLYFVADAASGEPLARANVEFFGWWSETKRQPRQHIVHTRNFAEFSDANGFVRLSDQAAERNYQWLTIARTQQGRFAFHGFDRIWFGRRYDREYNQNKTFVVTDRPVYRPGQTVQFKFWVRHSKYDQQDVSQFAGQSFRVVIANPKGEKLLQETSTADEYGGLSSEFVLDDEAALGNWNIYLEGYGGSSFRVEEYKKPEFEVSIDAPSEPVQPGEKITATINAKYYFGAPVTKARVKYKVLRSSHDSRWFPRGDWDWFYGRGYWWFGYDYDWYPGWSRWGCLAPSPWWWPRANDPPEVVAEAEAEIGPDGTLAVEIDTELAKEMHGDQDHRYEITAEVVDESRRTIVGKGEVLVAREPFKVFAWVNRGHFKTGDTVTAEFQAQTLDQKPVTGAGELTLYKVDYRWLGRTDGKPIEQAVETWELDTDAEGRARQQFKAAEPGQYRLSYKVTDAAGHTIEGGYLFNVTGAGFNGETFRFNDLELIPDKREYQAGETVRLMINSARRDATVLLFLRPTNGVYLPPKLVRLDGRSTVEELAVAPRDMPNFFVEALTVFDARVHTETREIVVPPGKRVLNVEVLPSAEEYKPGEVASVRVRLTDHEGRPFVGSTVLSVYDRSVEYISGGSNVPEIREFFWKWRRHHRPQTQSSLDRWSGPLLKQGETWMSQIGVFGDIVLEGRLESDSLALQKNGARGAARMAGGGFVGGGEGLGGSGGFGGALPQAAMASGAVAEKMVAADAAPGGAPVAASVEPTVRSNFADTAFWTASLMTDENGEASVTFPMPESLTAWKVRVWGMGHGTRVGEGSAEVVTAKKLLVRLQAPRFFVERDEVVLSANVHNYLDEAKDVDVALELEGDTLATLGANLKQQVTIPAGGEQRVDWRVKVTAEGEAVVRMKALTDAESDAMQMSFPCFVHGILKTESFSGVVRREEASQSIKIRIPDERRPEQSRLEIRYSPTLAGAMVDALPYLVDYPYGCTEQTLNRFVPTAITQSILREMNLDLQAIRDKRTNLNAQEIGDDRQRRERWKTWDRNPVFDEAEVTRMVKSGVERLTSMQNSDGGWGWFSGFGERSYPHTTAVVVHGLAVAQANDAALVPGTLENGVEWLKKYQAGETQKLKNAQLDPKVKPWKSRATDLDALVFSTLDRDAGEWSLEMAEFLYRDRIQLSVYGKVLFALALTDDPTDERLAMLKRNIEQFVVEDAENQTAYLRLPEGTWWWSWWGNDLEANAWYLKLLAATDPESPRAAGLAKYLLNNRRNGYYWRSTRDTAYCIEALADYVRASGEDRPDMTIEVLVDGQVRKSVRVTSENLFSFDNQLVLEGDDLASGEHSVEVRRQGTGPVYFNAYSTNFTLEEFITKTGLEVKVQRRYFRLKKVDATDEVAGARGQVVSQKVEKYERETLDDLATVTSGDLVEVELEIESKNDYEYLVFEDPKAAGFEPVDLRSGYTGNEMGAYVEYRDEKVALFVRALPRGRHSVSYRLRAEIPGKFHALPTQASAMYAPELKANSDEIRLNVEDR